MDGGAALEAFRAIAFLKGLPAAALSRLCDCATWTELPESHMLIEAGQEFRHGFFVLAKGEVEIFRHRQEGLKIPLAHLSATASFGELGTLTGEPGSACVATLTPSLVAEIPGQQFREVITEFPQVALDILRQTVNRIRTLDDEIVRLSLADHLLERLYQNAHPWTL